MMYQYSKYKLQLICEETIEQERNYRLERTTEVRDFLIDICELDKASQEHFVVIAVNAKGNVIGWNIASIGDLTSSIVHPREVLKFAIQCNAAAIFIAHNHPSGNPTPSKEDISVTERLVMASDILGIKLLDHIIIGEKLEFVSLKGEALM